MNWELNKFSVKKEYGFTLIELLVVISIIAILMSILMPALSKARIQAQEVICKTNLHQYAIATDVYAADYDNVMPNPHQSFYSKTQFAGEQNRFCRWHNPEYNLDSNANKTDSTGTAYAGPFWPYLASTKASVCPVFKRLAPQQGAQHVKGVSGAGTCIGGPFEPQFSYSMNALFYGAAWNKPHKPVRKSSVRQPYKTFIWGEENMWKLKDKDGTQLSNYVLNDNHLIAGADCFGSFHQISTSQLNEQIQKNEYSGKGVSNAIMVDGSIVVVSPTDTAEYSGSRP